MRKELKIISLSEIKTEEVKWLWYPYIPFGKVTIVQGDPGEGKTTFVLSVIAALTRGDALPECETGLPPMNVIYQTAEDGLADTIKPRLEAAGADCTRVQTIDDSKSVLTLTDQRLEEAIHSTDAGLLVLDPLQAYLGSGWRQQSTAQLPGCTRPNPPRHPSAAASICTGQTRSDQ